MKRVKFLLTLGLFLSLLAACGDNTPVPASSTNPATTGEATTSQDGAKAPVTTATLKMVMGDGAVKGFVQANQGGDLQSPLDSTPDYDGTTIYFTATGPKGPGVFKAPASGGNSSEVFSGGPFVAPRTILMSPAKTQVLVADPQAVGTGDKTGQIFVVPVSGGAPVALKGSAGTEPQNMDLYTQNGQSSLYFTGKNPASGKPALLKLPLNGADKAEVVIEGGELTQPDGVAVTRSGAIYLSDRSAGGGEYGKLFKVSGPSLTSIVGQVKTGNPAGIVLNQDQSVLMVSAHQLDNPNDQVLLVDLTTLQTASIKAGVSQNQQAGGVHASPGNPNILSWADLNGGPNRKGGVYTIILNSLCADGSATNRTSPMCLTACCK